jgi:ankyrin repeat protein
VRTLLTTGGNINERDPNTGYTALHTACLQGNVDVVKVLLKRRADPAIRTISQKLNAVHAAAFCGHVLVLETIKKNLDPQHSTGGTDQGPGYELRIRSQKKSKDLAHEKWQGLVESTEADGRIPLHFAAEGGSVETVKLLIKSLRQCDAGCRDISLIDTTDLVGWTALHLAARKGKKEVVQLLLQKGANILLRDNEGCKPLDLAENSGHEECVVLIKKEMERNSHIAKGKRGKNGEKGGEQAEKQKDQAKKKRKQSPQQDKKANK